MWRTLAWLGLAGALGTLARCGLGGLADRYHEGGFPWGTLAVNAAGCLLFGLVWVLAEERCLISSQASALVLIGFMGAFTTFSSYLFETGQMLRHSEWLLAAANFVAQNTLGFVFLLLGAKVDLRLEPSREEAAAAIRARCATVWEGLFELDPARLERYGPITSGAAAYLEFHVRELGERLVAISRVVSG